MTTRVQHSNSLILIWQVAEFEARQLKASTIEPVHLLLGLCKTVDLDLPDLISRNAPNRAEVLEECLREVRRLRNVFQDAKLNAAIVRRRLRRLSGERRFSLPESERLHRSDAAKKVFANAEHFAQLNRGIVYPVHLLYAVLGVEDEQRDQAMNELGIQKARLCEAAKHELFSQCDKTMAKTDTARWN
jgi:ATP-dependent Clp protease ATP-binding subunit ClpA